MTSLPSYLAAAKPVPSANRAPWYKTIMPAYLGVMLWFVFWQSLSNGGLKVCPPGGTLAAGLVPALLGLVLAAAICHFLFYLVPGMLGMQTGLPLYVVGTSTYGAKGGLFMPGLLMGLLQFGWLAVNGWAVGATLCACFQVGLGPDGTTVLEPGLWHGAIASAWILLAAFVGLKGIQYVGPVGTYLPLIPVVILLILLGKTFGGLGGFDVDKVIHAKPAVESEAPTDLKETPKSSPAAAAQPLPLTTWQVVGILCIYVVGFFATAGAAGTDIAMSSRNVRDVHVGGLMGILVPTILAGGAGMLVVAGAYGAGLVQNQHLGILDPVVLIPDLLGKSFAKWAMVALAISAFPGACFSSFIAANSFKTTMPKVNPFLSVGIGALVAMFLAVTGVVGTVIWVFQVIGASFGPVCGAMLADYLLSGRKWSGPRAGFNPAGWISWIVGFVAGAFNLVVDLMLNASWAKEAFPKLADYVNFVPVPPVAAMVVGFVLYLVLSLLVARTKILEMPQTAV